jgi:hypothetical protein
MSHYHIYILNFSNGRNRKYLDSNMSHMVTLFEHLRVQQRTKWDALEEAPTQRAHEEAQT